MHSLSIDVAVDSPLRHEKGQKYPARTQMKNKNRVRIGLFISLDRDLILSIAFRCQDDK